MQVRLIVQNSEDGNLGEEYILFTEDFDCDAEEFKYPKCTITIDKVIEMEEVSGFPLETDFKKN